MVDGKTPDATEDAAAALFQKMQSRTDLFLSVRRPDGGPYFEQHGLLYLKTEEVQKIADSVIQAQPFIGSLTADPSLRGLFNTLSTFVQGVEQGAVPIGRLEKPLAAISRTLSDGLAGGKQPLSWQTLLIDRPGRPEHAAQADPGAAEARLHRPEARRGRDATLSATR